MAAITGASPQAHVTRLGTPRGGAEATDLTRSGSRLAIASSVRRSAGTASFQDG